MRRIAAVTASRALVDAAAGLDDKAVRVAVDSARWRRLTSAARLHQCAAALPPHYPGAARILALLADGTFDPESEGERALATVVDDLRPAPRWGVWIAPDIKVDLLFDSTTSATSWSTSGRRTTADPATALPTPCATARYAGLGTRWTT